MAAKKQEKKPTAYVVLTAESADGPYDVVGRYTAHGQLAVKKLAAGDVKDAENLFFIAVPASSFYPQKPVVQMVITFLDAEGAEEQESEDEPEDDEQEDEPAEDEPEPEFEPLVPPHHEDEADSGFEGLATEDDGA